MSWSGFGAPLSVIGVKVDRPRVEIKKGSNVQPTVKAKTGLKRGQVTEIQLLDHSSLVNTLQNKKNSKLSEEMKTLYDKLQFLK